MTPYAILLVRPADTDETIRAAFHKLSVQHHPDKHPGQPVPREWYAAVAAYSVIKSQKLRAAYDRHMLGLSGLCCACRGSGVRGSRVGRSKVQPCQSCAGEGRTRRN
jgi:DnaJ-class molecular chaperone